MTLKLKLPWPPSINDYKEPYSYKVGRRTVTQFRLNDKARKFRVDAVAAVWEQLGNTIPTPTKSRLSVRLLYCAPSRANRDLDNFAKGVLDALTHAKIYEDDSQIDRKVSIRGPIISPGFVIVSLRAISCASQLTFDLGDDKAPPF